MPSDYSDTPSTRNLEYAIENSLFNLFSLEIENIQSKDRGGGKMRRLRSSNEIAPGKRSTTVGTTSDLMVRHAGSFKGLQHIGSDSDTWHMQRTHVDARSQSQMTRITTPATGERPANMLQDE
jgi:hypothetical protein